MSIKTIGIVGFGRFGRVLHQLFKNKFDIVVSSSSHQEGDLEGVGFRSLEETVYLSDLLFLAVPIRAVRETALRIKPFLCPGHIVADVSSVKEFPFQVLTSILKDIGVHIWLTHPMFGPDSVKDGFRGLTWVSCEEAIDPEIIAPIVSYLEEEGVVMYRTDCTSHDQIAARTQGLTHFIGRVLNELHLKDNPIDTLGYRRLTEVKEQTCNDSFELFYDLMHYNRFSREVQTAVEEAVVQVSASLRRDS
jgi:prephenate dehydrogenase